MSGDIHRAGWRSIICWVMKRAIATVVVVGWVAFWGMILRLHLRDGDLL